MDFEDINGDVSSDNDSYGTTMDALLLEEEAKEKHNVPENFIEKSTDCDDEFNFIEDEVDDEASQDNPLEDGKIFILWIVYNSLGLTKVCQVDRVVGGGGGVGVVTGYLPRTITKKSYLND